MNMRRDDGAAALIVPEVARWLRFIGWKGEPIEMQALEVPRGNGGGDWTDTLFARAETAEDIERLAIEIDRRRAKTCYYAFNTINPIVASRNELGRWLVAKKGHSLTDDEMVSRRALFIDIDRERPKDTSTTEAELQEALLVSEAVSEDLERLLIPSSARGSGMSGNGASVMLALDNIKESPELKSTISGILAALHCKHGTAEVYIDPTVIEAKRLCPLWGTTKRKGASGRTDRPHRRSTFACEDVVTRLTMADLQRLLADLRSDLTADQLVAVDKVMKKRPTPAAVRAPATTSVGAIGDPFALAKQCDVRDVAARLGLMNGDEPVCPGCGITGDSSVAFVSNGLKCSHARCADKGYRDGFRTTVDMVMEANGCSNIEAVRKLGEWFGFEVARKHLPAKTSAGRSGGAEVGDGGAAPRRDNTLPSPTVEQKTAGGAGTSGNREKPNDIPAGAAGGGGDAPRAGGSVAVVAVAAAAARPDADPEVLEGDVIDINNIRRTWRSRSYLTAVKIIEQNARDVLEGRRLEFNDMAGLITLGRKPIKGSDVSRIRGLIEDRFVGGIDKNNREIGMQLSAADVKAAVEQVAAARPYYPVQEYLKGLVWDGRSRLDHVAEDILGAAGTEINRVLIRKFFVEAAARGIEPGIKADTVLVLVGEQGALKSSFFRVLAGDWFSDTPVDISSDPVRAYMAMRKAWILEWAELESLFRARDTNTVKAFLSSCEDDYTPKHATYPVSVKRAGVIVGTSNPKPFLSDETGERRFWTVTTGREIDLAAASAQRDQLWAEAAHLFRAWCAAGQRRDACAWWLSAAEDRELTGAQEEHRIHDAWEGPISEWIDKRHLMTDQDFSTADVLAHALGKPRAQWEKRDEMRVATVMKALGWKLAVNKPQGRARPWEKK